MKFEPLVIPSKTMKAPGCNYVIRRHANSPNPLTVITFSAEVAQKAKWAPVQHVRIDIARQERCLRFTTVDRGKRCVRRFTGKGKRRSLQFPCVGEIAEVLPAAITTTELPIIEISSEGVTVQLPPA